MKFWHEKAAQKHLLRKKQDFVENIVESNLVRKSYLHSLVSLLIFVFQVFLIRKFWSNCHILSELLSRHVFHKTFLLWPFI